MHRQNYSFEKGTERILQKTAKPVQVVFLVNIVDYFSQVKPQVDMYMKEYNGNYGTEDLEKEFNQFYKCCMDSQVKRES